MKHVPPLGATDPNAPYIDGNPQFGIPASCVPAQVFNDVQAEILNVIKAARLTPDAADLSQMTKAIESLITTNAPLPAIATSSKTGLVKGGGNVAIAADGTMSMSTAATTAVSGLVALATTAEVQTGTNTTKAVTSAGVTAALAKYKTDNPAPGIATTSKTGLVKGGGNIIIDADGTIRTPIVGGTVKALVYFDGRTPTVIKKSYNVSSVVRVSTGVYTINYTVPLDDANYVILCSASDADRITSRSYDSLYPRSKSSATIVCVTPASFADAQWASFAVIGA